MPMMSNIAKELEHAHRRDREVRALLSERSVCAIELVAMVAAGAIGAALLIVGAILAADAMLQQVGWWGQ